MPVFGADLSDTKPAWEDTPTRSFSYGHNQTHEDAKYFVYHPVASLEHPYTPHHWSVILAVVGRLRKRGYDSRSIRGAMNAFYLQRNDDTKVHPVYSFARTETLNQLMSVYEPAFINCVMRFIAEGFIRGNDSLPWHADDDIDIRRSILTYGDDLAYRYPEVVAELLMEYGDTHDTLNSQLRYINEIVRWNTDRTYNVDIKSLLKAVKVPLPAELSTTKRSPHAIRPPLLSLRDAVVSVPKKGSRELRNSHRLEK